MNSGGAAAPRHTDWLRHDLVVTGPAADVASLRGAAAGAGAIPWHYPDVHLEEEDRVHALLRPPDGSSGLSLQGARALARMLRSAAEARHGRVVEAVTQGNRSCPFDLHALLPVPEALLRLGPDGPASLDWLRAHWGTVRALRQVHLRDDGPLERTRHAARLRWEFWAADWTPWAAFQALRANWPRLMFDVRPDYRQPDGSQP